MKHNFATTKTVLISLLLVLAICCLALTVALTYREQNAQAEGVISAEQLPDADSSDDYPIMPIADETVTDEAGLRDKFTSAATNTVIKLGGSIKITEATAITHNRANITLTLDLNGYTLTGNGTTRVIAINNSTAKLILKDSSGDNSGAITGGAGGITISAGTLEMIGGTITGNTVNDRGGGVYVSPNCTFTMSGGRITQNVATGHGGGVLNRGKFTMSNTAEISRNITYEEGGGVRLINTGASFEMNGGTISGNMTVNTYASSSGNGGGVLIGSDCTFTMNSGTISNNIA